MGQSKKQRHDIKVTGELGSDIRTAREARKIGQKALGLAAGYSESYVSRIEGGTVIPSQKFVEGCDRAFGTGTLFQRQLRRAVEGEHPAWFAPYIELEREASTVRDFSTVFIAGLLQTPDYARGTFEADVEPAAVDEIEAQVTSRMRRRDILANSQPTRAIVVLHEACLRVQMRGSARVMVNQLAHILTLLKEYPTLTVQVLPYSAGGAGRNTPFTILDMSKGAAPVVYSESPSGGRPTDVQDRVAVARKLFDHLRACALSPQDSEAYLRVIKEDHERDASVDQVQLQRRQRRDLRRVGPGSRARRRHPRPGQ